MLISWNILLSWNSESNAVNIMPGQITLPRPEAQILVLTQT